MKCYIGCICLTWLHCVFSNVSSKYLDQRRYNQIVCIGFAFLHMCVLRFPVWYNAYLHWLFVFCPLFVSKSLLKVLGPDNAKSQCLHLYKYSLLCVLRFTLKLYEWNDAYWHRLNLFDGSLPCIFKCAFKLPFLVEAYSHWLHLVDLSPLCVIKCILKPAF